MKRDSDFITKAALIIFAAMSAIVAIGGIYALIIGEDFGLGLSLIAPGTIGAIVAIKVYQYLDRN